MCLSGCNGSPSDKINTALQLVNERPDSAYVILRDLDYNDLDADSLKARYILAKAHTDLIVSHSLITDTLLDNAAAYYISAGDTANWVMASQLLAGADYMKGDSESALRRLEDIGAEISKPELLWDNHQLILEVAINSGNYDAAYNNADWLLNHTDRPEHRLKFAVAKGAALYMQENYAGALEVFDSIIGSGTLGKVDPEGARNFYFEYAEILDGAGRSAKAIALIDSLYRTGGPTDDVNSVQRRMSLAQFYANSGQTKKAMELLDSINHDGTKSVFEVYAFIGMLKAALQFKETGRLPYELMHRVPRNLHRHYELAQFDRQTAMESVIKLNDDNYELKLQRQRLWLLVACISIFLIVCGAITYFVLNRRKQRMIEAEERAETLEQMLKDTKNAEEETSGSSDSEKLKGALLRQLGIFKIFAGTPTQQSREALKKISTVGNGGASIESLVDWPEFYSMIDNLYEGFHTKLVKMYPGMFNEKEQQIIVLLKAGFSTKEIGVLTEQSSATIYTRKSIIRKKLGTPENGDIIAGLEGRIKDL